MPPVYDVSGSYGSGITINGTAFGTPLTIENTATVTNPAGIGVSANLQATVINAGTVSGNTNGISLPGGAVDNSGTITGSSTFGVVITSGIVTNESGGTITGGTDGIDIGGATAGTVTNYGSISGGSYGVYIPSAVGHVTNETGGTISSTFGAGVELGNGGTLVNHGVIAGTSYGLSFGRNLPGATTASISNDGTIDGGTGTGIFISGQGSLTNIAGGLIEGGVGINFIDGNSATIENAGTITGSYGYAIVLRDQTNRLIVDAGAVFNGIVQASGGSNTLELTSHAAAGTISGLGDKYQNFGTVTIDNRASWTVGGSLAGIDGSTIQGFNGHDTLDITDTAFAVGDTVSLDSGSHILSIRDSGSGLIGTVQLGAGISDGGTFHIADDGTGHIAITETITEISTAFGDGVLLSPGAYSNPLTITGTGTVSGSDGGISAASDWTIVNHGTINVTGGAGIYLAGGGSIANTGFIGGAGFAIRTGNGGGHLGAIDNSGTISGSGYYGVLLGDGGGLTNEAGGTISGVNVGVVGRGAASTIENAGTITGGAQAIYMGAGTNRLIVDGGAVFQGHVNAQPTDANTLELSAKTGAGAINGIGSEYNGFQTVIIDSGASWTIGLIDQSALVENAGAIGNNGENTGIHLTGAGSVINAASGTIYGFSSGVQIDGATGTVDNSGTVSSNYTGVVFGHVGALSNAASGKIAGVLIHGAGSVINAGTILTAHDYRYNPDIGDYFFATTGVNMAGGGSLTNLAGGAISGGVEGVDMAGANATVENAGTITGGTHAVNLNATVANRLIVDAGAAFNGDVVANANAANTIELTSHAMAGTLSGLGTQYKNFQTVTIDANAHWTIAGTEAGIGTTTIQGFTTHDRLDITDLTFASGDTVNINDTTDVLTILAADGSTVLDTVQLAGDFTGDFFHLADDGTHGSYITEDGTPCYCRGTMILTGNGEVAVEDLRIGDRLMTKSRALRRIKWIGRRSYNGRFAEGNLDVLPVLIRAGALADNVPRRNLWISPLHAMFIDGVLVPAYALINGTSIVQADAVDQFEYFHLELDSHDVIVAEGALSETFIDDDSRNMFHNVADYYALYPDAKRKPAEYCAPMVEHGPELEVIRRRIAGRGGWASAA